MINIDFSKLNPLERQINDTLLSYSKENAVLKISEAADLCGCSTSKISKFVKKLGFNNFKQYLDFLYGKTLHQKKSSSELIRIKQFIDDFDFSLIDEFEELMNTHDKIVLFGYGPSFICAQYFEYRLRLCSNKFIIAVSDEITIETIVDESTLLIVLTTTGTYRSFENIYDLSKNKGCEVLMIVEEYNTALFTNCDRIFWLSKFPQSDTLKPHEKSRSVFFIFIDAVIHHLLKIDKSDTM